ncbi:MAG: hypothetical protein ICV63_21425 [Coleofasciculus sp. Co-bin14]|nr:hypothetical protein [Coleofasciculus sp. Co-bin14]
MQSASVTPTLLTSLPLTLANAIVARKANAAGAVGGGCALLVEPIVPSAAAKPIAPSAAAKLIAKHPNVLGRVSRRTILYFYRQTTSP